MILTNEQVALLLERKRVPTLYRVHEQPDPARVQVLIEQLASLDVPTPALGESAGPSDAGRAAIEASRLVAAEAKRRGHGASSLSSLVLRSLKPARYSSTNEGHAGLGSAAYAHFTSPIRRYPDLIAHRGAALGRRSKRACADRARGLGRRRALLRQGAGLDADRARRRRRLRRVPAPARAVRARLGHGLRGRGLRRDLRGCFHPVPWSALRRIRGLLPGPAHARRTVRDQRRRIGADGNADGPSGRDRRRDRGQGRVGRGSPRPGRSDRRRRADAPQAGLDRRRRCRRRGGGGRNRNRRGSKGRR